MCMVCVSVKRMVDLNADGCACGALHSLNARFQRPVRQGKIGF